MRREERCYGYSEVGEDVHPSAPPRIPTNTTRPSTPTFMTTTRRCTCSPDAGASVGTPQATCRTWSARTLHLVFNQ